MKRIGIDIGGTQLRIASFDEDYEIIKVNKIPNDRSLSARDNLCRLLDTFDSYDGYAGIGIGCPGPLDIKKGKILTPPNLVGWDYFDLVAEVEKYTGIPACLNNDANVAGLAEARLGGGKGYESVCYVGISTGIGGAFIYKGEIMNGAHGNAAEFWNMIVNEDPHSHKNANKGSLNEQVSGSGLQTIASEIFGRPTSPIELFSLYRDGNKEASDIIDNAADAMAKGIANITCTIDPDIIVIGGSIAIHNPFFMDMIYEKAKQYCVLPDDLKIVPAEFGDDAGLLGAALLVR